MERDVEYWSTQKVATQCGVSRKTVTRWVDAGVLPAIYTSGGHRRIRAVDVYDFLRGRRSLHADAPSNVALDCVVISTDSSLNGVVKNVARAWKGRLRVLVVSSGFEAGLAVGQAPRSVIVVDEASNCDPVVVGRLASALTDRDTVVVACVERPSHARRAHLAVNGVRTVLPKPVAADALRAVFVDMGFAGS